MAFASSEVAEVIEAEPLDVADGVEGMAIGCSIWNKHKYLVFMILIKKHDFFIVQYKNYCQFFSKYLISSKKFCY